LSTIFTSTGDQASICPEASRDLYFFVTERYPGMIKGALRRLYVSYFVLSQDNTDIVLSESDARES